MDPDATLRLLHEAMESVDGSEFGFPPWEDVKTHLRDLEKWLVDGGLAPQWRPLAVPMTVEEVAAQPDSEGAGDGSDRDPA